MNICVYGSADILSEKCTKEARKLGEYIGKNGHTLIYGGFGDGLLGEVADEAYKNGADIISILPERPRVGHTEFQHARLTYREKDKRKRKNYRLKMQMLLLYFRRGWEYWMNCLRYCF